MLKYLNMCLIILLFPSAIAFSATSMYSQADICIGSVFEDSITLVNDDVFPKKFTIYQENDFPGVFAPEQVILGPLESQVIYHYITGRDEGVKESRLIITSGDEAKELVQTFNFMSCPDLDISISDYSYSNCPCIPTIYKFTMENTGDLTVSYDLWVDTEKDNYVLSQEHLTLSPGEKKDIFAYITLPCSSTGDFEFTMNAYSKVSGFTTSIPFYLNIRDGCYDFDVSFGNATGNNATSHPEDLSYSLCVQQNYTIPFRIMNKGELNTSYAYSDIPTPVIAPAQVVDSSIFLQPSEYDYGNITFDLDIVAIAGDFHKSYKLDIEYRDCSGNLTYIADDDTGRDALYVALLAIFVFFILLLLLFLTRIRKEDSSEDDKQQDAGDDVIIEDKIADHQDVSYDTYNSYDKKGFPWMVFFLLFILIVLLFFIGWFTWTNWPSSASAGNETNISDQSYYACSGQFCNSTENSDAIEVPDEADYNTSKIQDSQDKVTVSDKDSADIDITSDDSYHVICCSDDPSKERHCFTKYAYFRNDSSICYDIPENTSSRYGNTAYCLGFIATANNDPAICDHPDDMQERMCIEYYNRWTNGKGNYEDTLSEYNAEGDNYKISQGSADREDISAHSSSETGLVESWGLYRWYFLVIIAFILIIFLLFSMKKDRSRSKDSIYWSFLLVIFIILLFLLAILFFFTDLHQRFGYEMSSGNRTQTVSLKENSTNYVWNKNTVKTISMSEYIISDDPNITLIPTPAENITIETQGMDLVMIPDPGWSGIRSITIIAQDSYGSRAVSPDITLVVLDRDPFYIELFNGAKRFFSDYLAYIIAVFLLIIVSTIAVIRYASD